MNPNSIAAFHQIQPKLPRSEKRIMWAFDLTCTPLSREQLATVSEMKLAGVCGRVNALIAKGFLEVDHKAKSETTGKTVDFLIPTDAGQRWLEVEDEVVNHVS